MSVLQTVAVDLLTDYPALLVIVALVARGAVAWQSDLSWPEYRLVHGLKRVLFPLVERRAGNAILWVSSKGGRDDAEYLLTVEGTVGEVVRDFRRAGASLHVLNSLKRRPAEHGDPLSAAHVVWFADDDTQVEGYLFRNDDGTVDIYAHTETDVTQPLGHLTDAQTDGDPQGMIRDVFDGGALTRAADGAHRRV